MRGLGRSRNLRLTGWEPVVLSPRTDGEPTMMFDRNDVRQVHIWFGAVSPAERYALRFRTRIELDESAEAALLQVGRDIRDFSWSTFESYTDIHLGRANASEDRGWTVMVGDVVISNGPLLVINQTMLGPVRCQMTQTEGVRRLVLYRCVVEE